MTAELSRPTASVFAASHSSSPSQPPSARTGSQATGAGATDDAASGSEGPLAGAQGSDPQAGETILVEMGIWPQEDSGASGTAHLHPGTRTSGTVRQSSAASGSSAPDAHRHQAYGTAGAVAVLTPVQAGNGASAQPMPSGTDDDIIARRLRRAATEERDPVLRKKLWKEYLDYKEAVRPGK